ncbi:MAG: flavodoxin family protein [Christensenella sp.]|uniref:flavodoxin family protein n=1 Tax=Christensenella sp. TaxID=1935934 RepID=UPI002B21F11B|nr:flavodoxin family protein [Christensenella sp.]MEA5001985.1 flavodoxin family protein [Christensenella sp.]
MKVVAFNGSPRRDGNTYHSLKMVCDELNARGVDTQIVQVGGNLLYGCIDCRGCMRVHNNKCAIEKDKMNDFIAAAGAADGILIGSPVYFGNVTTETKALIDRLGRVTRENGFTLKNKPGAAVVTARRAGSNFTMAAINYLFTINQMPVVSSSYWNFTMACEKDEWKNDEEAAGTLKTLGENMAFMLDKFSK